MNPDIRFVGIAGPRMVAAGCHRIFDMSRHAAMLLGVLGVARQAIRMMTAADQCLRRFPFDAAVVVDSPTLHLPLVARAKAAGVPTLYYIAPQLWAWGAHRIHKIRNNVDRLACILPFEEEYFRNQGIHATFVGHPLADKLALQMPSAQTVAELRGSGQPLVALLPGSRKHIVHEVLPGQLEIAEAVARTIPAAGFVVSAANPETATVIRRLLAVSRTAIRLHEEPLTNLITACDLALVASGTTTLEVAMHGKPMIVMYNASRVFYHLIARWMIRTRHLSLPNILAGRKLVPEFMPYYRSTRPISEMAINLLQNVDLRETMSRELRAATAALRTLRASENTARILLELINKNRKVGHA